MVRRGRSRSGSRSPVGRPCSANRERQHEKHHELSEPPGLSRWLACLAVLRAVAVIGHVGQRQEAAPDKAAAAKAKPAAVAKQPKAADNAAEPAPLPLAEEDPAVKAILESKPATLAQCSRAAKILADLQRPDLAKVLLKKVLDAQPTEEQFVALANEFGVAMFLDLASQKELLPEARQLADAVVAANNRQLQDPKRLAGLIEQLQDPAEDAARRR